MTQAFDGDGQRLKKNEYGSATYQLRSTVLRGEVVADIYGSAGQANLGQKQMGHVYANGKELAEQNTYLNVAFYKHPDPSGSEDGTSYTHPDGTVVADRTQLDPAVVTGISTLTGSAKGYVSGPRRFTEVWVKRNGRWQMVGGQSTLVPAK